MLRAFARQLLRLDIPVVAWVKRLPLTIRIALVAGLVAVVAVGVYYGFDAADAWMPNVATDAAAIAATVAIIERLLERQRRREASGRVVQALRQIRGSFGVLADFLLSDYSDMHNETYVRPPADLRGLLAHWKAGLLTVDVPWPEEPAMLTATETLAKRLEQQIQRHERVLEHPFIEAAYVYMRSEGSGRRMYLDKRPHHDDAGWKRSALDSIGDAVVRFLDAYEPYARPYLDDPTAWLLGGDESIDFVEQQRRLGGPSGSSSVP